MNTTQPDYQNIFESQYKKLNPEQKKAVETTEGPVMVIAGPGTGKTEILTLRIANILAKSGAGIAPENILALTFTNAGVIAMRERLARYIGPQTAYRVGIFTFHSFAEEQMSIFPEYFKRFAYGTAISDIDRIALTEEILKNGHFEHLKTFGSDYHYVKAIIAAIDELKREGITSDVFSGKIVEQEKNTLADEDSYYKRKYKNFAKGDLKPQALAKVRKNEELLTVYESYQEQIANRSQYDFADMIIALTEAMVTQDVFHASILERYQYILVDEHQDTNDGQNKLLELLTDTPEGIEPNLFTVGDDKQAIYRFQGASVENFLHFKEQFPDITTIDLTQNYRSSQEILDTAHTLISTPAHTKGSNEVSQAKPKMHTELVAAGAVEHVAIDVHELASYENELAFVASEIKEKIEGGVAPSDIALMYLQNKNLPAIRTMLEKKGVPYVVASRENLLNDPIVHKLILLLRAVANPMNDEVMGQAMLIDFLGEKFGLEMLDVLAVFDKYRYGSIDSEKKKSYQRSLTHLISHFGDMKDLELRNPKGMQNFATYIIEQKEKGENLPFLEFFDQFVRESGFLTHMMGETSHLTHLRQVDTLLTEIKKNISSKNVYRITDFLAYIDILLSYEIAIDVPASGATEGVQLMTAHGSKGLEFGHVYITNVIHGKWDGKKRRSSFDLPLPANKSDLEDERRLFYVALTRAKQSITISYARTDSEGKERTASLFLDELDKRHLHTHTHEYEQLPAEVQFGEKKLFIPSVTDTDYIAQSFMSTPLSVSALNNYFTSPIVYFFRNLVRLPSGQNKSMMYGNVIHGALDAFFGQCTKEKKLLDSKVLIEEFEKALAATPLLHEYYDEFLARGTKTLTNYYAKYQNEFVLNLSTEKKIKGIPFELPASCHPNLAPCHPGLDSGSAPSPQGSTDKPQILLHGIIDKLEFLSDGTVRVIDYKTGKPWSEKSKEERENLERQIVFYKLLLDGYTEGLDTKFNMTQGVLDFVEPGKKGEYERHIMNVTKADVEALSQEIQDFAQDITSGDFLKREVPRNRHTAPYLDLLEVLRK